MCKLDEIGVIKAEDVKSLANDYQVGGEHYKGKKLQHWDLVRIFEWDYFQAQAIKYIMRYKDKNGVEDLSKAVHFIAKMIEIEAHKPEDCGPGPEYVDQ